MTRKAKKTIRALRCERPGCGHHWADHEHSAHPVPKAEPERCWHIGCLCSGYVGLGPASLRRSA